MILAHPLQALQRSCGQKGQLVHLERLPPREARYGCPLDPLPPPLQDRLKAQGRWPLYLHQVQALDALRQGDHVMVSTPAASGKSFCYHLPVLEALLEERQSRALYVYPTKALAQDQLRGLRELTQGLTVNAAIFDGDTPSSQRPALRRQARVILTNPDMLHLGILPNHKA